MNDSTIYQRIAYYENPAFATRLAEMMIPDAIQYIHNITFCIREAEESKKIYNDILKQLCNLRKNKNGFYSSFEYKIGEISVDGRDYARRNFREWCSYLHKIKDSLLQIINIIYGLHIHTKSVRENNTVDTLPELKPFWTALKDVLQIEFEIDNKSKHRLNVEIMEVYSSNMFEKINNVLKESKTSLDDLMKDDNENKIFTAIFDMLDYVVDVAGSKKYYEKAYAETSIDPEENIFQMIEVINDFDTNNVYIIGNIIEYKTKHNELPIIKLEINSNPPKIIYLASIYKYCSPSGSIINKVSSFKENSVDIYKDGKKVGRYKFDDKQDYGVHFYRFTFCN